MDPSDVNSLEVVSVRSVGKSVLVVSEKGASKVRRGILRFFGTVEFASGQFCGIELDTPQGKHNGSFKGIRYFQCAPEHGIFVPAEKVFNDPKSNVSKPKILTSSPSVTSNKGKFKKAQSDVHAYLASPSSSRAKDVTASDELNLTDTNLFQVLGTVSSDKKSTKFIPPPKISPKTMNPALIRPSSTSFPQPQMLEKKTTEISIVLDSRPKRIVPNRPSSVASTNPRNTLAIQLVPTHKKSLPLTRHRSLTENDYKNIAQLANLKREIPKLVAKDTPTPKVEIPDLSLEFSDKQERTKTKESITAKPSSLYEQQDTLAQSKIPEIPQSYDISVELNTFFESNQKFFKEANNAREIMQFIDKDKIEWDNKMDLLQERFRKLREDVEVLCYQHLEALSHLPSQTNEVNLENSTQEPLFSQNSL